MALDIFLEGGGDGFVAAAAAAAAAATGINQTVTAATAAGFLSIDSSRSSLTGSPIDALGSCIAAARGPWGRGGGRSGCS